MSPSKLPLYQIDAFAAKRFAGNPAAVVPLDAWPADDVMQRIAAENNLAETAFFVREGDGYRIRWFTPTVEVDLCGHATLASAYVLWDLLGSTEQELLFQSKGGPLRVIRKDDLLVLDFPARPARPVSDDDEIEQLATALGHRPIEFLKANNYMAVYNSVDDLRRLQPDFAHLKKLDAFGIIATAPGDQQNDYLCRYFAPGAGVDEDPATGSAQCTLIPYWSRRLGRRSMKALQISDRVGSFTVEEAGDRVMIGGRCHLFLEGSIHV
ncbi:MAG: PhzF family phenazine biosynthesis protein [Leptonema illini]|jgi:PhzF family phenazine biosynthesis protein|uniref:PhzF family phenazine biosynthesis protein n=1 Tax=Leptonema illini TaxID=183 RepID=A0A833H263_9LEPT|nr:MAG: PhzF family phenazine biosynthesis protein [Leptonema illini]